MANGINLIKKEVETKRFTRVEERWYTILNLSFILFISVLGGLAFVLKLYTGRQFDDKKLELFTYINQNLDTPGREDALKRINLMDDRYGLYTDLLQRRVDFSTFIKAFEQEFPNLTLKEVTMEYGKKFLEVKVSIKTNAYYNVYDFLRAISDSGSVFQDAKVKSINFIQTEPIENSSALMVFSFSYSDEENL